MPASQPLQALIDAVTVYCATPHVEINVAITKVMEIMEPSVRSPPAAAQACSFTCNGLQWPPSRVCRHCPILRSALSQIWQHFSSHCYFESQGSSVFECGTTTAFSAVMRRHNLPSCSPFLQVLWYLLCVMVLNCGGHTYPHW